MLKNVIHNIVPKWLDMNCNNTCGPVVTMQRTWWIDCIGIDDELNTYNEFDD